MLIEFTGALYLENMYGLNYTRKTFDISKDLNIKNTKYEKVFIQYHYAESKCTNKIVFVL